MQTMTHKQRVIAALNHEPVDRLPYVEKLWSETLDRYRQQGHIGATETAEDHFDMSMLRAGWLNSMADLDFVPVTLEEDDEQRLVLDGNGAKLRRHKLHSGTPEHVDFAVKDRQGWEERIKPPLLRVDRRRIPLAVYRDTRAKAAAQAKFFAWSGVAPFEQMHPVCGHEHMLMGMALDPDWVKDMVMTFARFTIRHLEVLFAEGGKPDGMWFYEDMGFKNKPFMSPSMYEEIIQPGHQLLFDFAHANDLKVIVHSCGFVEPLVPGLIEAGMDCLQAMEVKAGMDMPRLAAAFGDRISFCGNIDVRALISNDLGQLDAELQAKIPPVLQNGGGYILHTDHSVPPEVDYETLKYFFAQGSKTGL